MKKSLFTLSFILIALFVTSDFGNLAYAQENKPKKTGYKATETRLIFLAWLDELKDALKEVYFDSKFHGMDIDRRFDAAKDRIKSLDYDWQMYRVLVQVMMELDDSHTFIMMPPRKGHFDYGFTMQIIGADCLVTSVKKGSDAETVGLSIGDKILRVGKIEPYKDNMWKLFYVLYLLDPTDTVELTIKKEDGTERILKVKGKTLTDKEYREERKKRRDKEKDAPVKCSEISKEVIACKLYTFVAEKDEIDKMMKTVAGHSKLILDLRGNGGGYVDTEQHLTGYFFEHDVKILDLKSKKKTEARFAKSKGSKVFKGELAVLVDSDSASASEIFARVVQIEKRGKVYGDVSSGSVMTSIQFPVMRAKSSSFFTDKLYPLFVSMTIGDVIMSDGGRLEKKGVIPDLPIIPTSSALNKGLDPVLAVTSTIFGVQLSPEEAGKLHFITEKSNDPNIEAPVPTEQP